MTTPCSGPISLADVQLEVPGTPIGLGDADVRSFTNIPSGNISLFDCYCLPTLKTLAVGPTFNEWVGEGFIPDERQIQADWTLTTTGFSGVVTYSVASSYITGPPGAGYAETPVFTFQGDNMHMNAFVGPVENGQDVRGTINVKATYLDEQAQDSKDFVIYINE